MSDASGLWRVQQTTRAVRTRAGALLRVSGRSMMPWIRPGDVLSVYATDWRQVSPGEVIVFARKGHLITHRVIQKRSAAGRLLLVTKGDAVRDADDPISSAELLGRVAVIHRRGREIHLEELPRRALGWLLVKASPWSRLWYPFARVAKRAMLATGAVRPQPTAPSLAG